MPDPDLPDPDGAVAPRPEPGAATTPAPPRPRGHLLIAGATGTLLPAVHRATARGDTVTALARNHAALRDLEGLTGGRARPLPRDYEAPGLAAALADAARENPFTGALLYCPLASPHTVRALCRAVPHGPVTLVLTSAHAAPADGEPADSPWSTARLPLDARPTPGCRLLVLGWRPETADRRWHTPEEISDAALRVQDAHEAHDAVLGQVRPWLSRPR
ncbi:short chain dehydrogenase [Streptomyces sp. YIM 130001]|uniref:hypothetical protein n=1 Tax=Streptomyces sp. YIM 130001 TaxID=2259644 RepID=UPI000E65E9C0|nr:hypothetical protein [Streptomyces sp. YIM 130001]RII15621.1 short chain dehydrogenase [Streptomyces sp. YIM 130001]